MEREIVGYALIIDGKVAVFICSEKANVSQSGYFIKRYFTPVDKNDYEDNACILYHAKCHACENWHKFLVA